MSKKPASTGHETEDEHAAESEAAKLDAATRAQTSLRPEVPAALTIKEFGKIYGDLDPLELMKELSAQTKAASSGELGRAEALLTAQAHTLDSIFNCLARKAIGAGYLPQFEGYMRLALRAQSQCRATLEALSEMKQPRSVAFVGQANFAGGHQQVVNDGSRARQNQSSQNELLEKTDGQRLDPGATGPTVRVDKEMAAVGAVDRAEDA